MPMAKRSRLRASQSIGAAAHTGHAAQRGNGPERIPSTCRRHNGELSGSEAVALAPCSVADWAVSDRLLLGALGALGGSNESLGWRRLCRSYGPAFVNPAVSS